MIQAVLVNRRHPEYGVATVPFPISKEKYENTLALLEPLEIGDAVKRDCCMDAGRYALRKSDRLTDDQRQPVG